MLVGRDPERRVVDRLVASARLGDSGVLALVGEPGVGKTALLAHARSRLDGFRLLEATGTELERGIAFAGLLALLRPALPLLDSIPEPQGRALSRALALTEGSAADRFATGAATLSLVSRHAEDVPVALLVDDVHLLDRPSVEAIVFTARRLGADPVVVLLAGREGECEDLMEGLPCHRLTGLDATSARELLATAGAGHLTDEQVDRLHTHTGGNPLALLELGGDPAFLDQAAPELTPPVPASLVASYTRRLDQLAPEARSVLLVAVVTDGDLRLTAAACEVLHLDPALLAGLDERGLVGVHGGRVAFRHPLLRLAVHGSAPVAERSTVHRVVAGLLPADDTDRRAWHLAEATSTPDADVADMLAGTAEHAVGRGAHAVASTAFERAARLSPRLEEHVERLSRAVGSALEAGMLARARDLLDELWSLEVGPGHEPGAQLLLLRAGLSARSGSLAEARELLERAAATAGTPELTVRLLSEAVKVSLYLTDAVTSRRLAERLEVAVARTTSPDARAVGLTACGMARVLTGEGGAAEIRAAVPLLAASAEVRRDPARWAWLLLAPLFLRDTDSGQPLRRVLDEVRSGAGVGTLPHLLLLTARDQATRAYWDRAAANFHEGIRLARETGQGTELAMLLAGLTALESRQGLADACRAHAAEAMPLCDARQIRLGEIWVRFALGDLALSHGETEAAIRELEGLTGRLVELGVADVDVSPAPELADALLRVGRRSDAERAVDDYVAAARAKAQPWALARAHRALGLLAPASEVDRPFETALALHARTPDVLETARTRLAYGSRLRRAGRRVDARPHLRRALAELTGLGAARWAEVAATELAATGETVPQREPTGISALTAQELQVALLLAEGRTTRETAAALFLSPKTVEYHLRKVYVKLGIGSRAELADRMPR